MAFQPSIFSFHWKAQLDPGPHCWFPAICYPAPHPLSLSFHHIPAGMVKKCNQGTPHLCYALTTTCGVLQSCLQNTYGYSRQVPLLFWSVDARWAKHTRVELVPSLEREQQVTVRQLWQQHMADTYCLNFTLSKLRLSLTILCGLASWELDFIAV